MIKVGSLTTVLILSFLVFSLPLTFADKAKTIKVLKNVYTITSGDGIDSNTTFIITKEGVIVIDTRPTPAEARKVLAEIRKLTALPIVYTINTHYHGDHTFGNQVFKNSKTIIAHKNVRNKLIESGQKHLSLFKTFGLPGIDEVEITPPNIIYEKEMEIWLGEYRLQLLYHGKGHTDGDTIIYIDQLRTVITGDLVFNKKIPYTADSYIDDWIDSLKYIELLKNETVIPGHGPIGERTTIISMKHYLMNLKELVLAQLKDKKTLKETQEIVEPILRKKYKDWEDLDWIKDNIERAWLEYSSKQKT
ncbi:MAG: MBL fold metallo-hydrolase [Nitrospinaceae bacterium]|jgi:cyclase|tara:strand:+ start:832 stop:1746 length:915 start_codon:yes stop_codon:yes gene_type:complete